MQTRRKKKLDGLPKLAADARDRGYETFAEYCDLRENRNRQESLEKLSAFIKEMKTRPLPARTEFADWLLTFCFRNPTIIDAYPTPLKRDLVLPTIHEWTRAQPENPKALRWHDDERALLVAARSQPADEIAIGRYAAVVLSRIDRATHKLPAAYLGESLHVDLAEVQTTLDILNAIPRAPFFESLREDALLLKLLIQKQLKSSR